MAHELSAVSTGSGATIVCIGDAWHGLQNPFTGDEKQDLAQAGLDFECIKLPIYALRPGAEVGKIAIAADDLIRVEGRWSNARSDTLASLGIAADGYKVHQPSDLHAMIKKYFASLELSSMGSLKGGKEIWVAARYPDATVGGMKHHQYALLTTSFDTTQASRLQPTSTNVVCNNTMRAAWAGADCMVKWNHSQAWNPDQVAAELARVLEGHAKYKVIGDALASVQVNDLQVRDLFKALVGIDPAAKKEDIATRTLNNYSQLWQDFFTSAHERNGDQSAFTALNAVTRYVDHSKTVRNGDRMSSATFGAGDRFKGEAMALLMPLIADRVAA
jgi:phage/plasmid-like protein (TIGR03299 family)